MKFKCTMNRRSDSEWFVRHASDLGTVEVTARSRKEALEKMENELRYRLEMCPCTGQAFRNLEIELVEK
jgi:hypothetical protein